jgi:hypothetical protein
MNEIMLLKDLEIENVNTALVKKVSEMLPILAEQARNFDRHNSQTTLTMMSLTMLNGQSPFRMLRQILAEVEKRKAALYGAQESCAKTEEDIEKLNAKTEKSKLNIAHLIQMNQALLQTKNVANGTMKDIAILSDAYEAIKEKNNIGEWDESSFEKEEQAHHVRRGFEMLYRNIIQYGRGSEATLEYMQQYGVHVQLASTEVRGYIEVVQEMIEQGKEFTSLHLEDFLDEMRDKYKYCAEKVSERIFNKTSMTNQDYMRTNLKGKL